MINKRPKSLALCIPAFNAALYLPTLLNSAKTQHIPFDEILVYNDCSTDQTREVALAYGAKVFDGKKNIGCSAGKNFLATQTKCEWLHFHDADDDLYPNFTTLAHNWLNKPNVPDIVLFDYEYREMETSALISIRRFNAKELEKNPIRYSILEQINPFCGLYNTAKFLKAGGYDTDPKILYNEDVAMHCKMAIFGLSFSSESEVSIINYRVRDSMSSGNLNKTVNAQYEVMKKISSQVGNTYYTEIATKLWAYARHAAHYNEWELVKKILNLATKLNGKKSLHDSRLFNILLYFNPYAAVLLREKLNRLFKKGYDNSPLW